MSSVIQSPWTLREAATKKGRCSVSGNGPLTFQRLLDVVADAAFVAGNLDAESLFRKCGVKLETSEHKPNFGNKTAGCGRVKSGSGSQISVLLRTSGIVRRKYAANFGTLEHIALFMKRTRR